MDERFEDLVQKKFDEAGLKPMTPDHRAQFFGDNWECGIKRSYDGRPNSWVLDVPSSAMDLENLDKKTKEELRNIVKTITITSEELEDVFKNIEPYFPRPSSPRSSRSSIFPMIDSKASEE